MDKLNRLERAVVAAEDSADDARWAQAEEVVRRLDKGETQQSIAASWTNLRTGKPYTQQHVAMVARLHREHGYKEPSKRPRWADVYDVTDRTARARQQAPKTVAEAEALGKNLAKGNPEVFDAMVRAYREAIGASEPLAKPEMSVPVQDMNLANERVKRVIAYIQAGRLNDLDREGLSRVAPRVRAGADVVVSAVEDNVPISGDWDAAAAVELTP